MYFGLCIKLSFAQRRAAEYLYIFILGTLLLMSLMVNLNILISNIIIILYDYISNWGITIFGVE